jgi:hypothetical protein
MDTLHQEDRTHDHCGASDFDIGFRAINRGEDWRKLDARVKDAAMSDMTEIAAAKLAQERGNAQEKTFAGRMITDHTKTSEDVKSMAPADAKAAIRHVLLSLGNAWASTDAVRTIYSSRRSYRLSGVRSGEDLSSFNSSCSA